MACIACTVASCAALRKWRSSNKRLFGGPWRGPPDRTSVARVIVEDRWTKIQCYQVALVVWTVFGPKTADVERDLILGVGLPVTRRSGALSNLGAFRRRVFDRLASRFSEWFPSSPSKLILQIHDDGHRI